VSLVLDTSAAVEMVLRTPQGRWLRERLDWRDGVHAPELLHVEGVGVLRRYEVRGALNPERAALAFRRLLGLPVLLTGTTPLLEEAWTLRANDTVADACYVVLARHLHATLVTADGRLGRAPLLGIETLVPRQSDAGASATPAALGELYR
jgi:predicted nucleic acid-binding protein